MVPRTQLRAGRYINTNSRMCICMDSQKMKTETVTILREEYERLKKLEKVDWELVESFKRSLEDLKQGRIRRVK